MDGRAAAFPRWVVRCVCLRVVQMKVDGSSEWIVSGESIGSSYAAAGTRAY